VISQAQLALSPFIFRALLIGVFIVGSGPVYALNPEYPLSKYIHSSWGRDSGLLTVRHVAQTPDGYLWLATSGGLVRFDGLRFTTYTRASDQSLDNSSDVMIDPDGSLWVATFGGVIAHFQSGKFHSYASRDGLPSDPIHALYRDSQGVLWVGTREAGIFRMAHGRFEKVSLGIPRGLISSFLEDSDQSLWIATYGNGMFRVQNGNLRAFSVKDGLPDNRVVRLYRDHSGKIWTVGLKGISTWNGTRFVGHPAVNSVVSYASACTEDRDGNLWIASATSGLYRMRAGQVTKMDASSGLSTNNVQYVYEDREGNIWLATDFGLDRLRDAQVRTFTVQDGLFRGTLVWQWPIIADRSAGVWTASGKRIGRIAAGQFTVWPLALPSGGRANTMLLKPDSGLLVGADRGLEYWSPAHAALIREMAGMDVRSLLPARDGSIWIGTANRGLLHWKSYSGSQTKFEAVIPDNFITTLAEGHDRTIWAGSHGGGLYRIAGNKVQHFGQGEGLTSSDILTVFVDRNGALWIGSTGGLSWFQDGHIHTVNSEQGLRSDLVLAILDDSYDRVWFLGHVGVAAIQKKSLSEWAAGRRRTLNPIFYQSADGMPLWTVDRTFPNAVQSVDGHLWFAFGDGLAEVTPPNAEASHELEFPVVVEDVTIDGISHSDLSRIQIPPGAGSVGIRYTALTLSSSETVRFRYRLEGIDDDWVDADTRRIALYNSLKPGAYTFRVEASSGDERWLESSTLLLEQIPFFYQTKWFLFLVSAAAASLVFFMYRLRLRLAVDRLNAGFQQRIDERARIARELHDTLLQSFNALVLRFQAASDLLSTRPDEAKRALDCAIDQTAQALIEGRDAVQQLRSTTPVTNDLVSAIDSLGQALADDGSNRVAPAIHIEVEGTPRDLLPITRDEVYQIALEALRNAFRHARARHLEVEICYDTRQLRLRIRDDGKGIDPQLLRSDGPSGHYGLRGMRERAQLLGGQLTIWSEVNSGTEIDLSIPSSGAYTKPSVSGFRPMARRRQTKS
jgi:signal transduction histidine kinase/ligand-binding sensor domain-containing protein